MGDGHGAPGRTAPLLLFLSTNLALIKLFMNSPVQVLIVFSHDITTWDVGKTANNDKWGSDNWAGLFEPFTEQRSEALWRPLLLQRQNTFNNGTTWCINFYLGAHHRNRTVAFLLAIKKRTLALSDFGIEFELDFGQRGPWQLVKRCQQKVEASLSLQGIFGLLRISLKQAWPPPPPSSNGKMHLQIRESLTSQLYKSNVATKKLLKTAVCLITREHTGGLFYSALMNSPKTK